MIIPWTKLNLFEIVFLVIAVESAIQVMISIVVGITQHINNQVM